MSKSDLIDPADRAGVQESGNLNEELMKVERKEQSHKKFKETFDTTRKEKKNRAAKGKEDAFEEDENIFQLSGKTNSKKGASSKINQGMVDRHQETGDADQLGGDSYDKGSSASALRKSSEGSMPVSEQEKEESMYEIAKGVKVGKDKATGGAQSDYEAQVSEVQAKQSKGKATGVAPSESERGQAAAQDKAQQQAAAEKAAEQTSIYVEQNLPPKTSILSSEEARREAEPKFKLFETIAKKMLLLQYADRKETFITLENPPMFKGAQLLIREFKSALGQYNIFFYNLSPEAQSLLQQKKEQEHLQKMLQEQGLVYHQLIVTHEKCPHDIYELADDQEEPSEDETEQDTDEESEELD